jgi:hypothetical protein
MYADEVYRIVRTGLTATTPTGETVRIAPMLRHGRHADRQGQQEPQRVRRAGRQQRQHHRSHAQRLTVPSPWSVPVSGVTWYAINFNHRQEWVPASEVSSTRTT